MTSGSPLLGGNCYNITAFASAHRMLWHHQPAINVLKEIQHFSKPTHQKPSPFSYRTRGLTKVFDVAGLMKYWFPVSRMPKNDGKWPTVDDMVLKNQRLVVFTSKSAKEASEGISYGDGGMIAGSCPNNEESPALNATLRSLVLVNYFPDRCYPSLQA
uniref:Uncharacterized protein n=1 Tax=Salix viminalis TaxID=40686 RepID=A0A6N2L7E4_SALVM